ncbi:MAG: DMT family transporter [Thermomicrobiales bacterium]
MSKTSTIAPAALPAAGFLNWPAFFAIVVWSGMSPLAKFALREFPSLAYTAYRPLIATALLFALLVVKRSPIAIEPGDRLRLLLAGTAGMGLSQLFYIGGLARTSVSHNVILISSSPLLAAGFHWIVRRRRPDRRTGLGVVGGFVGVVLLVVGAGSSGDASPLGDLLSLGAAVTWMGASIWPAPLLPKYGTIRTTAWLLAGSMLVSIPVALPQMAATIRTPPSPAAWGSLLYSVLFGILIGNTLWQRAIRELGPSRTFIYLYLEPVGALALAALFLGERLSLLQAAGGLLALAGVALVKK